MTVVPSLPITMNGHLAANTDFRSTSPNKNSDVLMLDNDKGEQTPSKNPSKNITYKTSEEFMESLLTTQLIIREEKYETELVLIRMTDVLE